jgi:hypothetical protein
MSSLFKVIALICIWSTPIQIFVFLWGLWIIIETENTFYSLTNLKFIELKFYFLTGFINWLYTWFWVPYLDFILSLPLLIHQSIKAIISTFIGFWILKKLD